MSAAPVADPAHEHRPEPVDAGRRGLPAWAGPAAVGAVGLAGCLTLRAANPTESSATPLCPFRAMTGLDCPGCGATRATNALLHGHLGVAADHNLLYVLLLPIAIVAFGVWFARSVGFELSALQPPRRWLPALIVVTAAFWMLRLLPWEPFAWLASTRG